MMAALMLSMWTVSTRAQLSSSKAPRERDAIELESKPPDEPSSDSTPDVETTPDHARSPSSSESDDEPLAAESVAHPPEIETYVVPDYPPKARAKGIEGRVMLSVVIDKTGKVEDKIDVVDSIPMLDQAAIDAVRRWSFTPGRDEGGHPVKVQMEVPVPFALK